MSERRILSCAVAAVALSLALPLHAAPGAPGPEAALRLDDAVRLAARQNPALAARLVDVRIADARVLEAKGLDDFLVGATAGWAQAASRAPLGGQPLANDTASASATLTRPIATGGRLALRFDVPWQQTTVSPAGGGAPFTSFNGFTPSLSLSFAQPLLRGRGYDVARAPQRRAAVGREVAAHDLDATANVVVRDVALAYWELALAVDELGVRRAAMDDAREQLSAVKAAIDVGKQPMTAAAEVEVAIALREDEAIRAESAVAFRAAELGRQLGVEAPGAATLVPVDRPDVDVPPVDRARVAERALERHPALAALRAEARRVGVDIDVARNGLLPALDVFVAGGPAGASADVGRALENLATARGYAVQAGLSFQEPIELRAQRGARDVAEAVSTRVRVAQRDLATRVVAEVTGAAAALAAARSRAGTLAHAVEVAELDLAGERARFQASRSTNFDVLRRQQLLAEARLRLLRAKTDRAQAAAAIDALTFDLLARFGLALASTGEAR